MMIVPGSNLSYPALNRRASKQQSSAMVQSSHKAQNH